MSEIKVEQKQCYHIIQVHLATARFNRFITLDLIVLQVSGTHVTCSNLTPLAFNDLDLACVEREKVMKRFLRVHQKPIGNYKALVRFLEDFKSSKNTHKKHSGIRRVRNSQDFEPIN